MLRIALLFATLYGFWLLLSGFTYAWFLVSGALFALGITWYASAKGLVDREGFPVGLLGRAVIYWPWLIWQIVLSSISVTRLIWSPSLPITPMMRRFRASQSTSTGLATYANSITLTPGTISVEVSEAHKYIWVHAIEAASLDGMEDDPMDRKVTWFEGKS